jgi:Flp pilus assembly pilin Flp
MTFISNIKNFAADESGAVTVDWVVLTAAIVGLGIAVVVSVRGGVSDMGDRISNALGDATFNTSTGLLTIGDGSD